jgi:hypothetical protein
MPASTSGQVGLDNQVLATKVEAMSLSVWLTEQLPLLLALPFVLMAIAYQLMQ